jgi:hypothetical protein
LSKENKENHDSEQEPPPSGLCFCPWFRKVVAFLSFGPSVRAAERPDLERHDPELHFLDHHDVSSPLRELAPKPPEPGRRVHDLGLLRAVPPNGTRALPAVEDAALQTTIRPLVATTAGLNFAGVGNGDYGFVPNAAPPDTEGAVGSTQYVQWVNESFAVFDKSTGALLYGPAAGNTLWTGFGGGCETNNDGDPIAQYDKIANRWACGRTRTTSRITYSRTA